MSNDHRGRRTAGSAKPVADGEWLREVAEAASRTAGGTPAELLGEYLPLLAEAATHGRRPRATELEAVGRLGRRAAEQGISAGQVVDLYLSASWQLWQGLPMVARSRDSDQVRAAAAAVLHVVDDAVATLAEAYAVARRHMVRREEAVRRELVDDLLRGEADIGGLVERAEPFGLDLTLTHKVALAAPGQRLPDTEAAVGALERVVLDRLGDRDVLVANKDGGVVVLFPGAGARSAAPHSRRRPKPDVGDLLHSELRRLRLGQPWRVAVGRPYPGAYGIARSYEEAREALDLAQRLHLDAPVVYSRDLLIYRVLIRDQPAMVDLVQDLLGPLTKARGGAEPLLDTLDAYFATGCIATETGRRLHLSVRAVTYRLERVRTLTGHDPTDPEHRFPFHAALLGAKLLGWPQHDLPSTG
jgi:sugar diacid utilization regulator